MNATAMFECRTAEQTEVNSKMYCKGHETKYGGKKSENLWTNASIVGNGLAIEKCLNRENTVGLR